MRKLLVLLSLILMFCGVGCMAISKHLTPAEKDEPSIKYVVEAGVAEPNEYSGYFNLAKAEKLVGDVEDAHEMNQFELEQAMQKDNMEHAQCKDSTVSNYRNALEREEQLFGKQGLLPLIASVTGFSGLAGAIGLMRKRPQDVTKQEMEQAVADATGKTTAELSLKEKQFIQVVNGISAFMKTYEKTTDNKEAVMIEKLKACCNEVQDKDTKVAVAVAKKSGVV